MRLSEYSFVLEGPKSDLMGLNQNQGSHTNTNTSTNTIPTSGIYRTDHKIGIKIILKYK